MQGRPDRQQVRARLAAGARRPRRPRTRTPRSEARPQPSLSAAGARSSAGTATARPGPPRSASRSTSHTRSRVATCARSASRTCSAGMRRRGVGGRPGPPPAGRADRAGETPLSSASEKAWAGAERRRACRRAAGGCRQPSRPGRHSTSRPTASADAAAAMAAARPASSATQCTCRQAPPAVSVGAAYTTPSKNSTPRWALVMSATKGLRHTSCCHLPCCPARPRLLARCWPPPGCNTPLPAMLSTAPTPAPPATAATARSPGTPAPSAQTQAAAASPEAQRRRALAAGLQPRTHRLRRQRRLQVLCGVGGRARGARARLGGRRRPGPAGLRVQLLSQLRLARRRQRRYELALRTRPAR